MTISINGINQSVPSLEDYGRAVQDITELKTVGPSERADQQHVYVEDELRPYWFDLQSVAAESLPTIVSPGDAPAAGRWIRLPPEGGGVPAAHGSTHKGDGSDPEPVATPAVSGDMSAADKTKLDTVVTGADVTGANPPQAHTHTHASTTGQGIDDHHAKLHAVEHAAATGPDPLSTAVAGAIAIGDAAAVGVAETFARSDHKHSLAAPGAPINVTKDTADAGSSPVPARADHKHDITTATPSTIGTANDEGFASALSRSDHFHDHGAQVTGTHHAAATESVNGFLSAADKAKLNNMSLKSFQFFADQLDNPVNADWIVNALAPAVADSNNNGLTVRAFDDTTEEGVGFILEIPAGATNLILKVKGRAETGPPAARTVGLKLYQRGIPDNAAVEAWSAGLALTDVDIPTTTELFQYDEQTITLASLGIAAGEVTQFEFTRVNPAGGTELVGDWNLLELGVGFS